jgi:ABC-type transporter Mla subunit MlaD
MARRYALAPRLQARDAPRGAGAPLATPTGVTMANDDRDRGQRSDARLDARVDARPDVTTDAHTDWRTTRDNERAAAETREPERAARVRAEDDAETRARQDAASEDLTETARALADSGRGLRETRERLQATGRDLSRTSEVARDVLENASTLRAEAEQIREAVREVPLGDRNEDASGRELRGADQRYDDIRGDDRGR